MQQLTSLKDMSGNLYFACFNSNVIKTDSKGKILAYIGDDKLQRCIVGEC